MKGDGGMTQFMRNIGAYFASMIQFAPTEICEIVKVSRGVFESEWNKANASGFVQQRAVMALLARCEEACREAVESVGG